MPSGTSSLTLSLQLWEYSHLGYPREITLQDESSIAPSIRDAGNGSHHSIVEHLCNNRLGTVPISYGLNTAPVSIVNLYLTSCARILVDDQFRTQLYTGFHQVGLHDAHLTLRVTPREVERPAHQS